MIYSVGTNMNSTPEIQARAARVLFRLVEHLEDDGSLNAFQLYINRAMVSQLAYNGHPFLLFAYWARLQNNDEVNPYDVRDFRDMLRTLANLSADFNTKLAIQARKRPTVPDPRNYSAS